MTDLFLNRIHYPVTTLGPGRRVGIWVQGCTIGCDGCVAKDTWATDYTSPVKVTAILEWLDSVDDVTGITISGGEPFQQAPAVAELLLGIHEWRAGRPIDVLVYSGYPLSLLRRDASARRVLTLCDAVLTGPYVARRTTDEPWRGSSNQRLVPLTPLGEDRYRTVPPDGPRLQAVQDGNRLWFIGIPNPGEMDHIADHLTKTGITYTTTTWRT
ncbi:radical SAM protein [Actinomadura soli]|uniref:Radical SAM protein n=1 Tax=Actinomadura soli TaxID=2508997 RepID=A0A5C4JFN0_9ACTN|nr:4Fe-4S single cluster domain-containing protein [Actinomadura soli]TMR03696.1 radical SAM protein [Actinomadura soli]